MRRNFAQVLKAGKIDPRRECSKLFSLFYGGENGGDFSLEELIESEFYKYPFRGTCLDLKEFAERYGFSFTEQPKDFDTDYLISFCEYFYNLVLHFEDKRLLTSSNKEFYLEKIRKVVEAVGYTSCVEDVFTIFVPKDAVAMAVSEMDQIPENLSYKVIAYDHHSMKGNLEAKKEILLALAHLIEPKRNILKQIDCSFSDDLFYAFNCFNIRHNNSDPTDKKHHKKVVAEMPRSDLEGWYDEIYQMCLLAFMKLEQNDRKKRFEAVKKRIECKEMPTV